MKDKLKQLTDQQKAILTAIGSIALILTVMFLSTRGNSQPNNNQVTPTQSQTTTDTTPKNTIQTFTVGPEKKDCDGEGINKCLVVNGELFYAEIEGFDFEKGKTQKIRVRQILKYENPDEAPADAGLYTYQMIGVISIEE